MNTLSMYDTKPTVTIMEYNNLIYYILYDNIILVMFKFEHHGIFKSSLNLFMISKISWCVCVVGRCRHWNHLDASMV